MFFFESSNYSCFVCLVVAGIGNRTVRNAAGGTLLAGAGRFNDFAAGGSLFAGTGRFDDFAAGGSLFAGTGGFDDFAAGTQAVFQ